MMVDIIKMRDQWKVQTVLPVKKTPPMTKTPFNVVFLYSGLSNSGNLEETLEELGKFAEQTDEIDRGFSVSLFKDSGDSRNPLDALSFFMENTLKKHRPRIIYVLDSRSCEFARCDFEGIPPDYDDGVSSHITCGTRFDTLQWQRMTPMRLPFITSMTSYQPTCIPIPLSNTDDWHSKMSLTVKELILCVPPLGLLGGSLELYAMTRKEYEDARFHETKGTRQYSLDSQRYLWDGRFRENLLTPQKRQTLLNNAEDAERIRSLNKPVQIRGDRLYFQIIDTKVDDATGVVTIHGKCNESGHHKSICVKVGGVRYSFYIEMDRFMKKSAEEYKELVRFGKCVEGGGGTEHGTYFNWLRCVWENTSKTPVKTNPPQMRIIKTKHGRRLAVYRDADDLDEFMEISCDSIKGVREWSRIVKHWHKNISYGKSFPPLFHEKEPGTSQFAYRYGFNVCSWVSVSVDGCRYFENGGGRSRDSPKRTSTCHFEIHLDNVRGLRAEDSITHHALLDVMSFDIECIPANRVVKRGEWSPLWKTPNGFPTPYTSAVSVICFTVDTLNAENPPRTAKYAYYLREGAPIEGVRCYSFCSEVELIISFLKTVKYLIHPDIITGYNTKGFDIRMIIGRAKYLGIHKMVPLRDINLDRLFKPTKFTPVILKRMSSKAMGTVNTYDYNSYGIVNLDVLDMMKRTATLKSYTLNSVATAILGDKKNDLPYETMEVLTYGDPKDGVCKFVSYCVKDAVLPFKLIQKLGLVVNLWEYSKDTSVNPDEYYNRGQRVKVRNHMYMSIFDCVLPEDVPYASGEEEALYRRSDSEREDGSHFMRFPTSLMPTPPVRVSTREGDLTEGEFRELQNKMLEVMLTDELDEAKILGEYVQNARDKGISLSKLNEPLPRKHPLRRKGYLSMYDHAKRTIEEKKDMRQKLQKQLAKLSYGGAIVLEREAALVNLFVLILDFMSLYPTVMESNNICSSTKIFHRDLFSKKYYNVTDHDVIMSPVNKCVELGKGRFKPHGNKIASFSIDYEDVEKGVGFIVKKSSKRKEKKRIDEEEKGDTGGVYYYKHEYLRTVFHDSQFKSAFLRLKTRRFLKKERLSPEEDCIAVPVVSSVDDLEKEYFTKFKPIVGEQYWNWVQERYLRDDCIRPDSGFVYYIKDSRFGYGEIPLTSASLRASRASAKKRMKEFPIGSNGRAVWNGVQLCKKIINNSVYGFTGADGGIYFDLDVCSATTAFGRACITKMIDRYNELFGKDAPFTKLYIDRFGDVAAREQPIYRSFCRNEASIPPQDRKWYKDSPQKVLRVEPDTIYGDTDSGFFVGPFSTSRWRSIMFGDYCAHKITEIFPRPVLLENEGVAELIFFQGKKMYNMSLILQENIHNYDLKKRWVEFHKTPQEQTAIFTSSSKWHTDGTVFPSEGEWSAALGKEYKRRMAQTPQEWIDDHAKPSWKAPPKKGNVSTKKGYPPPKGKNTTKGLKNKRRDGSEIISEWLQTFFTKLIEEHRLYGSAKYLRDEILGFIQQKDVHERKLVQSKSYSRLEYASKSLPAHIGAIHKDKEHNKQLPVLGDRVPHIIVKGPKGTSQYDRSYSPGLFVELGDLDIDYDHYLKTFRETLKPILKTTHPRSYNAILYPDEPVISLKRPMRISRSSAWSKKACIHYERPCRECGRMNRSSALVFSGKNLCDGCFGDSRRKSRAVEQFVRYKEDFDAMHRGIMKVCYECAGAEDFECTNSLCKDNQWFKRERSIKEKQRLTDIEDIVL